MTERQNSTVPNNVVTLQKSIAVKYQNILHKKNITIETCLFSFYLFSTFDKKLMKT